MLHVILSILDVKLHYVVLYYAIILLYYITL